MTLITPADLAPFADIEPARAQAMCDDAEAIASTVAPCLVDEDQLSSSQRATVRAILRGAVLRWHDSGSGAFQSQTAGPFGVTMDNRQPRRAMFAPAEIKQLQAVCGGNERQVFAIETAPGWGDFDPIKSWLRAEGV